jgi:L-fucose mutarotase/ribose pyranase (RbsD/FucU family)
MEAQAAQNSWEHLIEARVAAFGHRNWIVVADAAYPKQVAAGVETVSTGAEHIDVLRKVLETLESAHHVRAIVYLDAELKHLDETQAPGIDVVRAEIGTLLDGYEVQSCLHEEIISNLDDAGKTFSVLLLKSKLDLPYTSVFLQLDCGYWSEEAELALRKSMDGAR